MNIFYNIEFLDKWYFLLLILIPFFVYFFFSKQNKGHYFIFLDDLKIVFGNNSYLFYTKIILLFLILINFIIIIANPNISNSKETIKKNGIDIVIALDISGSMMAEDLLPNRIESAKVVINNFIGKLKTDRIGLVIFAGKPFTSIPLTFDYNIIKENISNLSTKNISQWKIGLDGTAIGDAILMSKTLFKTKILENDINKNEREKVIILLTDGDANTGVEPILAGLSAKEEGIKIYSIGIGSEKGGVINYKEGLLNKQDFIAPLNEENLKKIAKDTNGTYFRAKDNDTFNKIFNELSKLEKNDIEIEIKKQYKQYYDIFLYSLIILMLLFIVNLLYKREV